jgi:hypothetical protein
MARTITKSRALPWRSSHKTGYAKLARLLLIEWRTPRVPSIALEPAMIAHRRTWFYRLAGQSFAQVISFKVPVTAQKAKVALQQKFGAPPLEIWSH